MRPLHRSPVEMRRQQLREVVHVKECLREYLNDSNAPRVTQGGLFVIDVNLATSRPEKAVVAVAKAGCTPVRLVLSPRGDTAYVTVRGGNAVVAFDTAEGRR